MHADNNGRLIVQKESTPMDGVGSKILRNIPLAVGNPRWAWRLLSRRLVPVGIVWKDPDSYLVVGSWTFGDAPRLAVVEAFPGIQSVDVSVLRGFDRADDTSLNPHEIVALSAIVRLMSPKRILEIGTFEGNTTLNLAANSPADAVITTVDLPPDWAGQLAHRVPRAQANFTGRAGAAQFRNTTYAAKIKQVFGDSAAIDWSGLGGPFDMIFIDGCHSYDYVKRDSENALSCVRPGGLLVWHDYGLIDDVSRAVDEIAKTMPVIAIRGTRLAVGWPS